MRHVCAWEAAAGSVGTAAVARTLKSLIRIIKVKTSENTKAGY